jgi:hypothetical protein
MLFALEFQKSLAVFTDDSVFTLGASVMTGFLGGRAGPLLRIKSFQISLTAMISFSSPFSNQVEQFCMTCTQFTQLFNNTLRIRRQNHISEPR